MFRLLLSPSFLLFALPLAAQNHPDYETLDLFTANVSSSSRSKEWKPGQGIVMEVSGMDFLEDGRLAVCLRKGEVWFLDGVQQNSDGAVSYHLFASGLHEPLGLLRDGKDLLVTQRTEVTRLQDRNGDDVADAYLTESADWHVSGNYHGYAYGPERDGQGNLWVSLNLDMGSRANNDVPWRGWASQLEADGRLTPIAAGLRSPCGLGANREGDMFVTDQQGTWIPTTPVYHLRKGIFCGNQESQATWSLPQSPLKLDPPPPAKIPYPEALQSHPAFVPPAVWLPYNKMGRSATDLQLCEMDGKFGPFDGQLLVGEFTNSAVNRIFLEKVDGEYQGACFPFLERFPAAVVRLLFDEDGSLYVGMTNRGWSSLGNRSYGLQRVRYRAEAPSFQIQEMRARPDGFELTFTRPVDPDSAGDPASYSLSSYTYLYSSAYGSEEIETQPHEIKEAAVSTDGRRVHLSVAGLRPLYVHELRAPGVRSHEGDRLWKPDAYYTLNRIPKS